MNPQYKVTGSMSVTYIDGKEIYNVFCGGCGFVAESIYDSHLCKPLGVVVEFR